MVLKFCKERLLSSTKIRSISKGTLNDDCIYVMNYAQRDGCH